MHSVRHGMQRIAEDVNGSKHHAFFLLIFVNEIRAKGPRAVFSQMSDYGSRNEALNRMSLARIPFGENKIRPSVRALANSGNPWSRFRVPNCGKSRFYSAHKMQMSLCYSPNHSL